MQSRRQYLIEWGGWGILAIALVAVLLLASCATVAEDIDFIERTALANATPTPNYPPLIIRVADPDATCRRLGTMAARDQIIMGCADPYGRIAPEMCSIFVGLHPAPWTLAHEKAHCKYGRWHQ